MPEHQRLLEPPRGPAQIRNVSWRPGTPLPRCPDTRGRRSHFGPHGDQPGRNAHRVGADHRALRWCRRSPRPPADRPPSASVTRPAAWFVLVAIRKPGRAPGQAHQDLHANASAPTGHIWHSCAAPVQSPGSNIPIEARRGRKQGSRDRAIIVRNSSIPCPASRAVSWVISARCWAWLCRSPTAVRKASPAGECHSMVSVAPN